MSKNVTVQLGTYDVAVMGAGIAGVVAAVSAAEAGARVALLSADHTFSGSSFFPGTWGLGLVGARDKADVDDFVETVCGVGRGMADPTLARALVEGVPAGIEWLEAHGVALREAGAAGQREYIPCFDHARRSWHGLERASFAAAMDRTLDEAGVDRFGRCKVLDLRLGTGQNAPDTVGSKNRPCPPDANGADITFYAQQAEQVGMVRSGAVVLATGGYGGLYDRTLTMPDVLGDAHALALACGAELVNMEFIQIMPGLVAPVGNVVFNEKTFRYAHLGCEDAGCPAGSPKDAADLDTLMPTRAEHGPFTASREDRAVDLAIAAAGECGAPVRYDLPAELPEFMRVYSDWFEREFGRNPKEGVRIAPYAHAANGGILVDKRARTGVPGLFACGECTGGMHGADRIGGLASANALVFGLAAGQEAALWAEEHPVETAGDATPARTEFRASRRADEALAQLRHTMGEHCLIVRTAEGLESAQAAIAQLKALIEDSLEPLDADAEHAGVEYAGARPTEAEQPDEQRRPLAARDHAQTVRAFHALTTAEAAVAAMSARTESRGAHFREDAPAEDPGQARPLRVRLKNGHAVAQPA